MHSTLTTQACFRQIECNLDIEDKDLTMYGCLHEIKFLDSTDAVEKAILSSDEGNDLLQVNLVLIDKASPKFKGGTYR